MDIQEESAQIQCVMTCQRLDRHELVNGLHDGTDGFSREGYGSDDQGQMAAAR